MKVSKEICQKAISFMNATTDTWLASSGSREDAAVLANPQARYSFRRWAVEFGLMGEDTKYRIDDVIVECPFHDDESPSFSFNDKKHTYHCFSCGCHGNIVNFLTEYDQKVNGLNTSYYQKLNSMVLEDPVLKADLGVQSIYVSDQISLEKGLKRFTFRPTTDQFKPSSYLELASFMQKNKATTQQIKLFILLMQEGLDPVSIYREVYNVTLLQEDNELDLAMIMEE